MGLDTKKLKTILESAGLTIDFVVHEDDDTNIDELTAIVTAAGLYARINATKMKPIRMDAATHSIQTVTYPHHEIHAGTHYVCRSYDTIDKNGTKDLLIVTPNSDKWGHMVIGFNMIGSTTVVELFEGVTTSNNGALSLVRNRNRNVADNNTVLIYDDPTVTGGAVAGNLIQDGIFGAGRNSFGGGARDNEELVLKPNIKYLLRFTEQDVEATKANHSFDWYEHTDRD